MKLRSVELQVTDLPGASAFLEQTWGLLPAAANAQARYFRGAGDEPFILSLSASAEPAVTAVTFSGTDAEVNAVRQLARTAGAPVREIAQLDAPGGGSGFVVQGPEAQAYRFVAGSAPAMPLPPAEARDKPIRITHAVLNTRDAEACEHFAVQVLGFTVSDRTRHMTFVRCNRKHHCVAYARSDVSSLNHVAFEMADLESVMRGAGRMRDAGFDLVWGPGRHGPGNNVFGYFIAPWGGVIEYTSEVSEVGDDYRVGGPEDWKWPAGRIDHWGMSNKDMTRIAPAERVYRFPPALHG